MSDKGTEDKVDSFLKLARHVFDTLWNWHGDHDPWHWCLMIMGILLMTALTVWIGAKAVTALAEGLSKLVETCKNSGLLVLFEARNGEARDRIRKRSQFCGVMTSDLASLAKVEQWNDQYFTDLEAEVETEGGYYASALHRFFRRRSDGLRKERSLIRAMSSSTERAIQLVGEPGAGKSVALRHLAMQLAERGKRSKGKHAIVPLYINLRELAPQALDTVNADLIRRFVIENVRRNDSDIGAFVRENWSDYRDRGVWFFLFDSFDEIPDVLHAETGSAAVRAYSQAIRQFLEGMGECRGILASREFKGPEALPWKRFRILPLSVRKQEELVRNSFLKPHEHHIVLHHLANNRSALGATPLFLTLLCRYVKDEHGAPATDHDLIGRHVDRLAHRDPEYLQKYQLTPALLIAGAERLARLFAEDASLGLAPTLEQIESRIPGPELPGCCMRQLMAALVDAKIGRADIPDAAYGDRRFAFAHRRYQEALFVRHLVRHPGYLPAKDLLTDLRWREYAVTLLQTQPSGTLDHLLGTAGRFIATRARQQQRIRADSPMPASLGYFDWGSEPATSVIELLQEGLARRTHEVPARLSQAIASFLSPRWTGGDQHDRTQVIRLGALLPQPTLAEYLTEAFTRGTSEAESLAFRQTAFLVAVPDTIRVAVLERLSGEILLAEDRADLVRLEALAARLPERLGADHVVRRCLALRPFFRFAERLARLLSPTPKSGLDRLNALDIFSPPSASAAERLRGMVIFMLALAGLPVTLILTVGMLYPVQAVRTWPAWLQLTAILAPPFVYGLLVVRYTLRAVGEKLGLMYFLRKVATPGFWWRGGVLLLGLMASGAALLGLCYPLGWGVGQILTAMGLGPFGHSAYIPLGFLSVIISICSLLAYHGVKTLLQHHQSTKALAHARAAHDNDVEVLYRAVNIAQAVTWLNKDRTLLAKASAARSFSALMISALQASAPEGSPGFVRQLERRQASVKRYLQLLEDRLLLKA